MTDDLIMRLTEIETESEDPNVAHVCGKAAEKLEAQAREIEKQKYFFDLAEKHRDELESRITKLETAMKPFKKYQTEYSDEYSKHPIIGAFLNELRQVQIVLEESDG